MAERIALAVGLRGESDPRSLILAALIALWALRLGSFLFIRVNRDGSDRRFDQIKISLPRFLMVWTLQALWVFLTAACPRRALPDSIRFTLSTRKADESGHRSNVVVAPGK